MIRRFVVGLLLAGSSIAIAAPADAASNELSATAANGDVMCIAIQPYIGYCVGNVPAAVLEALLP